MNIRIVKKLFKNWTISLKSAMLLSKIKIEDIIFVANFTMIFVTFLKQTLSN